jgi:hypothetical protein
MLDEKTEREIAERLAPHQAYNVTIANNCVPDWHPQKIKREHVEFLRGLAAEANAKEWHDAHDDAPKIQAIADILAAILRLDA